MRDNGISDISSTTFTTENFFFLKSNVKINEFYCEALGLIPRPLGRFHASQDTPSACGGVVHLVY